MSKVTRKLSHRIALRLAAVCAAMVAAQPAVATTYLPSVRIGTAALISPSSANTFYGSNTVSSDGLSAYSGVPTPTPIEVVELARALKNDPDLIYQYVHNNIQNTWLYGLQKGALGTEVDKAGTNFDQVELMVALLHQSGFATNYIASTEPDPILQLDRHHQRARRLPASGERWHTSFDHRWQHNLYQHDLRICPELRPHKCRDGPYLGESNDRW